MTTAVIVIAIVLVIVLVTAREYAKFKEEQSFQDKKLETIVINPIVDFKEEEKLLETQSILVPAETPSEDKIEPVIEAPKQEKPKRKYTPKKKDNKPKKTTK